MQTSHRQECSQGASEVFTADFGHLSCSLMRTTLSSPGIVTTGSTMVEHNYYVSAYRVLYSDDGQRWTVYREPGMEQDKVMWAFAGSYGSSLVNLNYHVLHCPPLGIPGLVCYCLHLMNRLRKLPVIPGLWKYVRSTHLWY